MILVVAVAALAYAGYIKIPPPPGSVTTPPPSTPPSGCSTFSASNPGTALVLQYRLQDADTGASLTSSAKATFLMPQGTTPQGINYPLIYAASAFIPNLVIAYETDAVSSATQLSSNTYYPCSVVQVQATSQGGNGYYDADPIFYVPAIASSGSSNQQVYDIGVIRLSQRTTAANLVLGIQSCASFAGRVQAQSGTQTATTTGVVDCSPAASARTVVFQVNFQLKAASTSYGNQIQTIQSGGTTFTPTVGIGFTMAINATDVNPTLDPTGAQQLTPQNNNAPVWTATTNQPVGANGIWRTFYANVAGIHVDSNSVSRGGSLTLTITLVFGSAEGVSVQFYMQDNILLSQLSSKTIKPAAATTSLFGAFAGGQYGVTTTIIAAASSYSESTGAPSTTCSNYLNIKTS